MTSGMPLSPRTLRIPGSAAHPPIATVPVQYRSRKHWAICGRSPYPGNLTASNVLPP
jgi:hypothetical protein